MAPLVSSSMSVAEGNLARPHLIRREKVKARDLDLLHLTLSGVHKAPKTMYVDFIFAVIAEAATNVRFLIPVHVHSLQKVRAGKETSVNLHT